MGNFNRDRSGGGRGGRSFGGGRDSGRSGFGRGDRRDGPQMHRAVCAECDSPCEVPFRPSGDKPVYCRECFGRINGDKGAPRGNDSYRDNRPSRDNRHEFTREEPRKDGSKEQFEMLNAKLDKILRLITPVIVVSKERQAEVADKSVRANKEKALATEAKMPKAKKAPKKTKK